MPFWKTRGLRRNACCTWPSEKNEGGISAPSETCKDIETDTAFEGRIQCIDDTNCNRCLKRQKKFRMRCRAPVYIGPMQRVQVTKGALLQQANASPTHAFHVIKGLLRAYFVDEKGKEHTYMFASEGWTIGDLEAAAFDQKTRLVIEALEPSEVEVFRLNEAFDAPVTDARLELKRMHRRAGALQRRVLMMMSTSALERYEHFLALHPRLSERIPQKLIASYLGITPQALSMIRRRRVKASRGNSSS